jgi:hypothetical protein
VDEARHGYSRFAFSTSSYVPNGAGVAAAAGVKAYAPGVGAEAPVAPVELAPSYPSRIRLRR